MTLRNIKDIDSEFLTAAEVATAMHIAPQKLREQAKADPSKIGFPVAVVGKRVLIPRIPFLKWLGEDV